MYSYDDLILFTHIVKNKSFIRASKVLNIAQSTISRRMKNLEERLGFQLFFNAGGRNITFTENAMQLHAKIEQQLTSLKEIDSLIMNLKTHKEQISGTLRVILPLTFSEYCITPYLSEFILKYPEIDLHIISRSNPTDLIQENIDVAILNHIPEQSEQNYVHIHSDVIQLYCTQEYLNKYGVPETPDDLSSHLCIGAISNDGIFAEKVDFINKLNGEVKIIDMPKKVAVSSSLVSLRLLESNEMIVALYEYVIKNKNNIVQVLPNYIISDKYNHYYIATHPHKNLTIINVFVEFIKEILSRQMSTSIKAKNAATI